MMSQAIKALTATAARKGAPMATIPKIISKTPQRMDHPEACRNNAAGDSVTMCASSVEFQDGTFCSPGAIFASQIVMVRNRLREPALRPGCEASHSPQAAQEGRLRG
jgi:hypothetical protein